MMPPAPPVAAPQRRIPPLPQILQPQQLLPPSPNAGPLRPLSFERRRVRNGRTPTETMPCVRSTEAKPAAALHTSRAANACELQWHGQSLHDGIYDEGRFANADSGGGAIHPKSVFTQGRLCSDEKNRNFEMFFSRVLTRNLVSYSAMGRFPANDQWANTSRVPSNVFG